MFPFTGALIAGGRSSRMGRDKAFLDWQGRPLWEVQLAKLRAAGAAELLVCGRRDQGFAGDGFRFVPDDVEDLGPLAGLVNALKAASHENVLVLAVDMPFITTELLVELRSRRREEADASAASGIPPSHLGVYAPSAPATAQGIIPVRAGRFEPLAAIYPRSALALAEARLAGNDRSLQGFCHAAEEAGLVRSWLVIKEWVEQFRSVNSATDLRT